MSELNAEEIIAIGGETKPKETDERKEKGEKLMKKTTSSTPAMAAAARVNGRKGGTKSPHISCWNSLQHALNAKRLSIIEGKYLPEYGEYAALHAELVRLLSPLSVTDLVAIDKFIADAWRLRRAFRFELSATERPDAGMLSPGMPNLLRYLNSANRQFDQSYARIEEICERKQASAAAQLAVAAARDLGGDQQTPSEPPAAATSLQTAPVGAAPLDSTPTTGQPEDALEQEQPRQSHAPTRPTSVSADAGDGSAGTAEQAAHSGAAAQAAQPGDPAAVSPTTDAIREQESDSPGEG